MRALTIMMRTLLTLITTTVDSLELLMMACLFEDSRSGLTRFVRYSPEGTIYCTFGTTCWEMLGVSVIYQSRLPSGPFPSVA